MLTLDLVRLERDGTRAVEADLPAESPLWEGTALRFLDPVRVRLQASSAGSGEVVVRGRVQGRRSMECRRCLEPVELPVDQEVVLVFAPSDALEDDDDTDVRPLPTQATTMDLSAAVREELILNAARYVVCDPDCTGLCPGCGANRNHESCECTPEEGDPRWDALRALKSE
jgi:uncharacterized protein